MAVAARESMVRELQRQRLLEAPVEMVWVEIVDFLAAAAVAETLAVREQARAVAAVRV